MASFLKMVLNKGFSDIAPVICGTEECVPKHSYGPATRSYWLLHFVISGKGSFTTPRGTTTVRKNDIFIIRPYEITYYEADENEPWSYMWIGFRSKIELPSIFNSADIMHAPSLLRTFEKCIKAPDSRDGIEGYEDLLCSAIWEIISFARQNEPMPSEIFSRYVKPSLDIMEAEFCNGIGVDEIAARLHLNRSYFSVIFSKLMKKTPLEYLLELRMERAITLLSEYGYNVTVTAISVGYSDVYTFSRAFKKYYGVPPSDYRSV